MESLRFSLPLLLDHTHTTPAPIHLIQSPKGQIVLSSEHGWKPLQQIRCLSSVEEKYSKLCKHCQIASTLKSRLSSSAIQDSSFRSALKIYPEIEIYFVSSTFDPGSPFLSPSSDCWHSGFPLQWLNITKNEFLFIILECPTSLNTHNVCRGDEW